MAQRAHSTLHGTAVCRRCCSEPPRASLPQVEADKAQRADRAERDPDFDQQQGLERDFVSPPCVAVSVY